MAIYAFRCATDGAFDDSFPMGQCPEAVRCPRCLTQAPRDFVTTLQTLRIGNDDAFRKAWLSSQVDSALAQQGRAMDPLAPKDKFEAKDRLRTHGRVYIGDDTSSLKPEVQKAIAEGQGKARIV